MNRTPPAPASPFLFIKELYVKWSPNNYEKNSRVEGHSWEQLCALDGNCREIECFIIYAFREDTDNAVDSDEDVTWG
jgi:hypothetical protein